MVALTDELIAAYRSTSYKVLESPIGVPFVIRIGERSPEADALCVKLEADCWAFITSCNPESVVLPDEKNAALLETLKRDLRQKGYNFYLGIGQSQDETWLPEQSLFVPGIKAKDAARLGTNYRQHAIVTGDVGDVAILLYCRSALQP